MAYQRRIRDFILASDLESLKEELEINENLVTIEIGRGNTLLHFACYENVDDCIAKWLVANGANMEVVNYDDEKPIDIACSKGGNRDAMLALLYNGCEVTEDDIDSDICGHQWWSYNEGNKSNDSFSSNSRMSMSFDSGPSRRNSTVLHRSGSGDSTETMDTFIDDVDMDDEPVLRRVPQSLCKQRDTCNTTQHNHLKTNNAWGKRAVTVLPRSQDNTWGKRAVAVLPRGQDA